MVFSYKMQELMEPQPGWWVVAYTEFAAKVAAFVLFEVYDHFRLWALSRDCLLLFDNLDLSCILVNERNASEFRCLCDVIRSTDFERYPREWRRRGSHDASAGRRVRAPISFTTTRFGAS